MQGIQEWFRSILSAIGVSRYSRVTGRGLPPPAPPVIISPVRLDSPCPACAHSRSVILCIGTPDGTPWIEHTCLICGCRWYEPTRVKPVELDIIHPANPDFVRVHQALVELWVTGGSRDADDENREL